MNLRDQQVLRRLAGRRMKSDVYRIDGDRARLRRWVELARSRIGGKFL